jgi:hypothetical protein
MTLGVLGAGAAVAAVLFVAVAALGIGRPGASVEPSSSAGLAEATPSSASSTAPPGGPIAEALVAALHKSPFVAHVDETTVARSTAGTTTVTVRAAAAGDVSGKNVSLHVTGTGAGPAVDQEVISVGDTAWIRPKGGAWVTHPRADAASAIDGLLQTIALVSDPNQLADLGVETLDGRSVHHLTAATTILYESGDVAGSYQDFDVWVTAAGIPVRMKGSFAASEGDNALVGNVDIQYSQVGGPITIKPPKT